MLFLAGSDFLTGEDFAWFKLYAKTSHFRKIGFTAKFYGAILHPKIMQKLNNIRRLLATLAVAATASLLLTIAFRMHKEAPPPSKLLKLPVQVDASLQRVHYTETTQGVKRWDLSADRAELSKQNDITRLFGVRLLVAGAPPTGELLVTAKQADYNNATRDVTLLGSVQGLSGNGISFSSARVNYLAARSQLQTGERVRLVDAGLELEGVGMEYDTQTRRFRLMKDVSAVYRPGGKR
jgi:LPS export ABC transporter protein LptC